MSDKPEGYGAGHCDACGREYRWGCGHKASHETAARNHRATKAHAARKCACYGHDYCDPKKCKLAGKQVRGYMPFYQHTEEPGPLGGKK